MLAVVLVLAANGQMLAIIADVAVLRLVAVLLDVSDQLALLWCHVSISFPCTLSLSHAWHSLSTLFVRHVTPPSLAI